KFFLYTLVGSVVMLLGVLKMYFLTQDTALTGKITQATLDLLAGNAKASAMIATTLQQAAQHGTGNFSILYMQAIGSVLDMGSVQVLLFFAFALGFAIKVPMFPFHTWLPDAHVEAPTAGSVILAGVLLKMGTYGFLRFSLPICPAAVLSSAAFLGLNTTRWVVALLVIDIVYGFIGEFTILTGAFLTNWRWAAWASLGVILGAAYMLWLYQRVFFGEITHEENRDLEDVNAREILTLAPLIALCFVIGIFPKPFF